MTHQVFVCLVLHEYLVTQYYTNTLGLETTFLVCYCVEELDPQRGLGPLISMAFSYLPLGHRDLMCWVLQASPGEKPCTLVFPQFMLTRPSRYPKWEQVLPWESQFRCITCRSNFSLVPSLLFIRLFQKHLLNLYYMSGTVQDAGNTMVNHTGELVPALTWLI